MGSIRVCDSYGLCTRGIVPHAAAYAHPYRTPKQPGARPACIATDFRHRPAARASCWGVPFLSAAVSPAPLINKLWVRRRETSIPCRAVEVETSAEGNMSEAKITWEQVLGLERAGGATLSAEDIEGAHQKMLAKGLDKPYSTAAATGRANVLNIARGALLSGVTAHEPTRFMSSPNAGGYLALLAEVGQHRMAIRLGDALLAGVESVDADCEVAVAMAHCALARDLEAGEEVSSAYFSLEAADALLVSSGASGMATSLMEAIEDSMQALKPFFVLDQLKQKTVEGSGEVSRTQLVQFLKEVLDHEGGEMVTSSYARAVLNELTAGETVGLAKDWTPDGLRSRVWWYSGLMEQLAAAHVALGFAERSPHLVERGMTFCSVEEDTGSRVCHAVCLILLGKTDSAFGLLSDANIQPWDRASFMWAAHGAEVNGTNKVGEAIRGAGGRESTSESLEDKKSYMHMFTKRWLRDVAFPRFRPSSRTKQVSFSLIGYFTSFPVQMYLIMSDRRALSTLLSVIRKFVALKVSPVYNRIQQLFRRKSDEAPRAPPLLSMSARKQLLRRSGGPLAGWRHRLSWLAGAAAVSAALLSAASFEHHIRSKPVFGSDTAQSPATVLLRQSVRDDRHSRGDQEAALLAEQAVEVLKTWQEVKNEALGSTRDSSRLGAVLCGAELGVWRGRTRRMIASELSWRYEARGVEVQQVASPPGARDGRPPTYLRVLAAVNERATLCDGSGPLPHHSYQAAYRMEYTLKAVQGTWKICKSRVVE